MINKANTYTIVALIAFILCAIDHFAQDIPEHPIIKPFPNSVLAENMSKYNKFDEFEFTVMDKGTKKKNKVKVKGKYWQLLYEVRTPSGERVEDISMVEYFENYKNAALEKGGEILFEDRSYLYLRIPKSDGGKTWCRVNPVANLGQIYLVIVDEEGFKQSLTFGADELKKALDADGKVILHGILFDLDKATLKQESEEQLHHIVTLMINYPDLKLEIQGHTDDQGKDDYNLNLSKNRAETVSSYLQLFGIDKKRLVTKGFGESKPIASNDSEEGREQNRRVELIKIN
ncbi:MAG: OmpA family protein [Ignavibacteriaceae bacterium]|jgi:outer membrane protein OmpA-like peptidoglycan-associated protein|nr:OmpA family protein [Ignavibacteriaceae bacterium]